MRGLKKKKEKDTSLGKTLENLTPMTIFKNEVQLSEFIIPRTCTGLLDNMVIFSCYP